MNIRLNGLVTINNEELFFEDFDIEISEDLDIPFDFLIDDEEEYDCDIEGYIEDCDR